MSMRRRVVAATGGTARLRRLQNVRKDSLESSEEGPEKRKKKTPCCKVIISERPVESLALMTGAREKKRRTHAKPTPAITGNRDTNFFPLYRAFRNMYEIAMTKMGVAALTTWWN